MKQTTFVSLDLSEFARPRKFSFNGVEYMGRVSTTDLPEGFYVDIDEAEREVCIRYHYLTAPDEPRASHEVNNAHVEIGLHSMRIFSLTLSGIDTARALPVAEAAKIFRDLLLAVFGALVRFDLRPGVKVGYEAACAGLAPRDEVTPPWMIEALSALRSYRTSTPQR